MSYSTKMSDAILYPLMNNTKWDELRLAMYSIDQVTAWSTLCSNGYKCPPDSEWYYHFREGGYGDIIYVDIFVLDDSHREVVREALQSIHLPGEETQDGFRIFGYSTPGQAVEYL